MWGPEKMPVLVAERNTGPDGPEFRDLDDGYSVGTLRSGAAVSFVFVIPSDVTRPAFRVHFRDDAGLSWVIDRYLHLSRE